MSPPGFPDSTEPDSSWSERDEAMHGLLEALFPTPEGMECPGESTRGRHLAPFVTPEGPSAPSMIGRELALGESLGRFRIDQELGRGGFGVVYRATDTLIGRSVALKVPRPDRVQSVALWDRFAREARLAGALDHEAIVPVLDAGLIDGVICVVSAFQEGVTLRHWLEARYPDGMPPRLAARYAAAIAAGLGHAHAHGVLHRDLKPANVLMVPRGAGASDWTPRIVDFGLGTIEDDHDGRSMTGFWQGSPPYMAPEQVLPDRGPVDHRADLYALGAILYLMLTGRPIHPSTSILELSVLLGRNEPPIRPRQIRSGLSRDLETIVLTCLEYDPRRRYPTAAALLEDLDLYLQNRPIRARSLSSPERLGRWVQRKPSQAALVALVLLAASVTTGLIVRHEWQLSGKNLALSRSNERLRATITERDAANAELKVALDRLKTSEQFSRRTAYSSDLHLAERELQAGRIELAQALLRRHEPGSGQEDLRGFAWHYLYHRATRDYTVQPFWNLSWWRGPGSLRPIWEQLDSARRSELKDDPQRVNFDPRGLRANSVARSFLLGPHYLGFSFPTDRDERLPHLWLDDGQRRIPTGLPAWQHALGPGGETLALVNAERESGMGEAPPLVRHAPLRLALGSVNGGSEGRTAPVLASIRVIEVPWSMQVIFSTDGLLIGCMAYFEANGGTLLQPLIYDLRSDWRGAYSQYNCVPVFPDRGNRSRRNSLRSQLALSPDGRLAAVSEHDGIVVFETRGGQSLWHQGQPVLSESGSFTILAFAPDGRALVTGDSSGEVKIWDAGSGKLVKQFPSNLGYIENVGFYPDAKTVAIIARNDDSIRLWNYAPEPEPPTLIDHGDEVWCLTFAEGGRFLVSAGDDHQAKVWDVSSGSLVRAIVSDNLLSAVVADRGSVVVAGFHGRVSCHGGNGDQGGFELRELEGTRLRALAVSPDSLTLVAGGNAPKVLVAKRHGRSTTARLVDTPHPDTYGLAFSPDGSTLAMGSHGGMITLWDVPNLHPRATLDAQVRVACVAISPDGKTLVSGDAEGGLKFWNLPAGTPGRTISRASDTGGVWSLAFSPDGKTLASGGDDGVVRLWDPVLATERLALVGHEAKVHAVTFSPDGKILASGDFAGKVRLWRTRP